MGNKVTDEVVWMWILRSEVNKNLKETDSAKLGIDQASGVSVTASSHFLAQHSEEIENRFVWAYRIEIFNQRPRPVKLLRRHWEITDSRGFLQEVDGEGVVGEQPLILTGNRFSYSSFCVLKTSSGLMVGSYKFIQPHDELEFEVPVPAFSLDSNFNRSLVN